MEIPYEVPAGLQPLVDQACVLLKVSEKELADAALNGWFDQIRLKTKLAKMLTAMDRAGGKAPAALIESCGRGLLDYSYPRHDLPEALLAPVAWTFAALAWWLQTAAHGHIHKKPRLRANR